MRMNECIDTEKDKRGSDNSERFPPSFQTDCEFFARSGRVMSPVHRGGVEGRGRRGFRKERKGSFSSGRIRGKLILPLPFGGYRAVQAHSYARVTLRNLAEDKDNG